MSFNHQFRTKIEKGKMTFYNRAMFETHIFTRPDGEYDVVIKKHFKQRSIPQNKYMHYAIKLIADHIGYEAEEMKDLIKSQFLKQEVEIAGKTFEKVGHTADLSTEELEELNRKIRAFGDELGVYVPLPGEADMGDYLNG